MTNLKNTYLDINELMDNNNYSELWKLYTETNQILDKSISTRALTEAISPNDHNLLGKIDEEVYFLTNNLLTIEDAITFNEFDTSEEGVLDDVIVWLN